MVFHSLRHSSITYKLKLNGGDMKAVQGDSGHAQVKMVADVYSHIIDDDCRLNAERLEEAFYSGNKGEGTQLHPKEPGNATTERPGASCCHFFKSQVWLSFLKHWRKHYKIT